MQVPGEMFALAMEAKKRGMGVVGSTQNILDFIAAKLRDAVERPFPDTLQVSLTYLFTQHMLRDSAKRCANSSLLLTVWAGASSVCQEKG